MILNITKAQAETHGVDYLGCLAQRNASISKTAMNTPLDKWKWCYEWCERVEGCSLMLSSKPKQESCEDIIKRLIANSMVSLVMYRGSCKYYMPLSVVPQPIQDLIRENEEKVETERKRYQALSQSEKDKELEETLKSLAGPGFAAFGHTSDPVIQAAKRAGVKVFPLE
jgi:hypothetical protein